MRTSFFTYLVCAIAMFLAAAPVVLAQNTPPATANQPAAEVMTEDDRLPFMQSEDSPAPREPSSSGLVIKSIGALVLVIGLLFFGTWTLKKLGFGGKKATNGEEMNLAIISSIAMGGGRTISTIQFGERVLLVGATAQNFTLLAEENPVDAITGRNPMSVAEMLADEGMSFEEEFAMASGRWNGRGGVS